MVRFKQDKEEKALASYNQSRKNYQDFKSNSSEKPIGLLDKATSSRTAPMDLISISAPRSPAVNVQIPYRTVGSKDKNDTLSSTKKEFKSTEKDISSNAVQLILGAAASKLIGQDPSKSEYLAGISKNIGDLGEKREEMVKENPDLRTVNPLERYARTTVGSLKNSASSLVNAAGSVAESWDKVLSPAEEAGAYIAGKLGGESGKKTFEDISKPLSRFSDIRKDAYQKSYEAADYISSSGEKDIQRAKQGLGGVGSAVVDIGAAGTQLGADTALGILTGGGSTLPMAARVFGGSTQEARQEGASFGQQIAYGAASSAVSVLTEKVSNVAKPFKKMFGGGLTDNLVDKAVEKAVSRFASSPIGKAAIETSIRAGASAAGEGFEEMLESAVNPALKLIYQADGEKGAIENLRNTYGENFDLGDTLYDGMIGAAIGFLGSVPEGIENARSASSGTSPIQQQNDVQQSDAARAILNAVNGQKNTADAGSTVNENGLISLSKLEQDNLSSGKRNKIVSTFRDAVDFIRASLSNKQSSDKAYLGKVPTETAKMVFEQTGVNIDGYNAILPSDAVRHMFKQHGNTKSESARGQVALTPESAANIPLILSSPDRVSLSNRTDSRGRPILVFEKQIGDYYITMQAVTDGNHSVQTVTLYEQKAEEPTDTESNTGITTSGPAPYVQNVPPSGSSVGQSIPQSNLENNPNTAQTPMENPVQETKSVGAAEAGFTGNKERGFSSNIASDESRNAMLREDYQLDPEMYHALSNRDTLQKANDIMAKGIESARSELEQAIGRAKSGGKLSPEMVPLAKMVADQLAANGDLDSARRITSDIAVELTAAGQLGQAAKILRASGPMSRIEMVEKSIDKINLEGRRRYGKKWNDFSLSDSEIEMLRTLENGNDAAFEEAYQKIAKRIGSEMSSTFWEKLTEIRRVSMLLNPKTQIRNIVSNVPIMFERKIAEGISGAIQDILVKTGKLSKDDQTRTLRVSKESRSIANEIYNANSESLLSNSDKWDMNSLMRINRKYFGDSIVGKGADYLREFTYMLLEKGDTPFFKNAFLDSMAQIVEARGVDSTDGVSQSMIDHATQQAMEATFKDASAVSDLLNKLKQKGGVGGGALDLILPFTTTPINLARQTVKYSPAGIAYAISDAKSGNTTAVVDDISRALVGSAGIGLAAILAKMGVITGAADDDKDKRNFDIMVGNQPFSFFGRVTYDWAQPLASQLAAGAAIYESIRDSEGIWDAFRDSLIASGDVMADMTVFSNIKDLFQGYGSTTENIVNAVSGGLFSQMTPSVFGAIARTIDDTVRSTSTGKGELADAASGAISKIPGVSKSLPASVDQWGRDKTRVQNPLLRGLQEIFNPASINTGSKTNVDIEIERLYEELSDLKSSLPEDQAKKIPGPNTVYPMVAPYKIDGVELSGEEREKYQRTLGETSLSLVQQLIGSDSYKGASAESQSEQIARAYEFANAIARHEYDPSYSGGDWEKAIEAMEQGIDANSWFSVDSAMRLERDKSATYQSDYASVLESVDGITDEQKGKLWQMKNDSWNPEKNPYSGTLHQAGIPSEDIVYIMQKYDEISKLSDYNKDIDARDQATEFSKWLDGQGFTKEQREIIDATYRYWTMIPAESRAYNYDTMTDTQKKVWDNWGSGQYSMDDFLELYSVMNSEDKKDDSIDALTEALDGDKMKAKRFYQQANKKW